MRALTVTKGVVSNIAIFDKIPKNWNQVPDGVGIGWSDNGDGTFSPPSKPSSTQEELASSERGWRDAELKVIDIEILKAEDDGSDTSTLRAFRWVLRDYPQQVNFPNGNRPSLT